MALLGMTYPHSPSRESLLFKEHQLIISELFCGPQDFSEHTSVSPLQVLSSAHCSFCAHSSLHFSFHIYSANSLTISPHLLLKLPMWTFNCLMDIFSRHPAGIQTSRSPMLNLTSSPLVCFLSPFSVRPSIQWPKLTAWKQPDSSISFISILTNYLINMPESIPSAPAPLVGPDNIFAESAPKSRNPTQANDCAFAWPQLSSPLKQTE